MAYKKTKFSDYRERINFGKVKNSLELADLLEIQKKSYQNFIENGIGYIFKEYFPVGNFSGTLELDFGDYRLEEPRHSINESKDMVKTYACPLKVEVRLINHETGEIKEKEIYMGDLPQMTDSGTFVINGVERVVVSQLVRSPSVYFNEDTDKNGRKLITAKLIPEHGTHLDYETDARDVAFVRIDRNRKMNITSFLRTFGLSSDDDILNLFGDSFYLENTIAKDDTRNTDEALIEFYEKVRPGEPATIDSAKNQMMTKFFDTFRYRLAPVGRYKFNKKLDVCDRLLNQTLAADIKLDKKVILKKGELITKEVLEKIRPALKDGANLVEVKIYEELDTHNKVQVVEIVNPNNPKKIIKVIGNDPSINVEHLTISDVYASVSYYLNILEGVGNFDEIDHLGNRRVRQVGELLQSAFAKGVGHMERVIRDRMTTLELDNVTPSSLINIRPVTAAVKEFFGSSQLSAFMDQVNPMAELANKRRLSALGPGGLQRERAQIEVRDVNTSHYGRICPIESPEGANIGLISNLASYAKINEFGFITTPYRKVEKCVLQDEIVYLTADEEADYIISQATINVDKDNKIIDEFVFARQNGENIKAKAEDVNFIDVSAQQVVSITTSSIPFLEHDDAKRALMGSNMQKQAVPLLTTEAPIIGTGIEGVAAKDSGAVILAKADGIVEYADAKTIIVKIAKGHDTYKLENFNRSNDNTCYHHRPIVRKGDSVKKGQVIADGPSTNLGELALGKNVTVAFMTFEGYNYEDAIILNERLVRDDVYTSLKIKVETIECRETKLGPEEITRDIPNVSEEARKNLDEDGIVMIGTEVSENDILVGKVTPKGVSEQTSEEKLLHAIFGEKTREVRDTSLRVAHGVKGIVHDVKIFTRKDNEELPPGVTKQIRVYIAQKRKIQVGDKMAGRHGNKGVISLVLPEADMPYLPDGRPIDIMLNPLGVPSRLNLGQILEYHLGYAARELGVHVATPVMNGASVDDIKEMMKKAKMDEDGKTILYDGRTGEPFENRISVGVMYMLKLSHMVDDKLHARSTGPYSLVTQQPLGGKAQMGGQRFGEMEVWALYAYGAAHTLQEILTVKSDDVVGRVKVYESLVKGNLLPKPGVPESFRVLIKELQALALDIAIDMNEGYVSYKDCEETGDNEPTTIQEIDFQEITDFKSEGGEIDA